MNYDNHWTGTVDPFPDETQIWYKIVVETSSGTYESDVFSYIVGEGSVIVTTPPTGPTGPTSPTGFTGFGEGIPSEMLMMVGGIGIVVVMLGIIAKRRK